jgi:hypothetical protein
VTGSGTVLVTGALDGGFVVELEATFDGAVVKQTFYAKGCPSEPTCG